MIKRWPILFSTLPFFSLMSAAFGSHYKAGDKVNLTAFCTTKEAVTKLALAATVDNDDGYRKIMNDPTIPCLDMAFHPYFRDAVNVTMIAKMFEITREDGQVWEFWRADDSRGVPGYVWQRPHTDSPKRTTNPVPGRSAEAVWSTETLINADWSLDTREKLMGSGDRIWIRIDEGARDDMNRAQPEFFKPEGGVVMAYPFEWAPREADIGFTNTGAVIVQN